MQKLFTPHTNGPILNTCDLFQFPMYQSHTWAKRQLRSDSPSWKSEGRCHTSLVTVLMVKHSGADLFLLAISAGLAISSSLHSAPREN